MSVAELLEVALRREELDATVTELLEESKQATDQGPALVGALLEGVVEARDARTGARSRSLGAESTAPGRLAAIALLADVDRAIGYRPGQDRRRVLRRWSLDLGARGTLGDLEDAVALAGSWAARARALLEPARTVPLRASRCPACGAETVVGPGDAGEAVVTNALVVDTRTGAASCLAEGCEATWSADLLPQLAQLLAQQGHETLAVEPNSG